MLSAIGLASNLGGLLALGLVWYFYTTASKKQSQAASIRMKYGSLIVDVCGIDLEKIPTVIDVPGIDDLAKIAGRLNLMILSISRDETDCYLVQSSGIAYRYVDSESRLNGNRGQDGMGDDAAPDPQRSQ